MKFLLDENVPISMKQIIINLGYEAITLKDENQLGIRNGDVADLALKRGAIILTLDSDFLNLKKELQKKSKIIYIKIHPRDPEVIARLLQNYLKEAIQNLKKPRKVIITENDLQYKIP